MNWLDKLERKFGRFAIPNLTVYLLVGYVIGFGIVYLMPDMIGYLTLEPALILRGQVWRIISWILIPPTTNIISLAFLVLLYYSLGTALERTWGSFRYNVYIFSGLLFTVLAEFGLYVYFLLRYGVEMPLSMVGHGQHQLYHDVDIPCFCSDLSQYGSAAVFYPAHQDEMDGACLCGDGRILFLPGRTHDESGDRGIAPQLCYLLPVQPEYETFWPERAGEESEI